MLKSEIKACNNRHLEISDKLEKQTKASSESNNEQILNQFMNSKLHFYKNLPNLVRFIKSN